MGIVFHGGGLATLYGVALIAGVIVLLPSLVKDFFALRVGKNLKRMWLDVHNVVGITALPFHIAMAITATALSLSGELWSLQEIVIFGGKQAILDDRDNEPYRAPKPIGEPGAMMAPSQLLQKLKVQVPDFEPRVMRFKNFGDQAASVRVDGAERGYVGDTHLEGVMLSAVTGELLKDSTRPLCQDPERRASETFFGLHTGQYEGVTITWAYFFLGFSGAWLFYSGNLLWIETRCKKRRARAARSSNHARVPIGERNGGCMPWLRRGYLAHHCRRQMVAWPRRRSQLLARSHLLRGVLRLDCLGLRMGRGTLGCAFALAVRRRADRRRCGRLHRCALLRLDGDSHQATNQA